MNNGRVKFILDIVMGTVFPILILRNLDEQLGTAGSYVAASLVPVGWVFIDLLFITKRFNVITSYVGASAIMGGLLTFWFVDGVRFALKDSFGSLLALVVFGASIVVGKPIMYHFTVQALNPNTPKREILLKRLFEESAVSRAVFNGTLLIFGINALQAVANFFLNLRIVVADFGTPLFNEQVAHVNAITRIVLGVPGYLALAAAILLIRRAISHCLPEDEDEENDLWDLLELRETRSSTAPHAEDTSGGERGTAPSFSGSVLIIGAGAAGLTAGYLLDQRNVTFQILEATLHHGGRMRKTDTFADFPIPLGAEWLTTDPGIFGTIVNDPSVTDNVTTTGYGANDRIGSWENDTLTWDTVGTLDSFNDRKFVNGTWFDFYEKHIVPSVSRRIVYNAAVVAIDYTGDTVVVRTQEGRYTADKVIVTAPLPVLQDGDIEFTPPLPRRKLAALNKAVVWDGIKVFLEFSQKFYPAYTDVIVTPKKSGHVTYFDAAYGQNTEKNILGLFAVGRPAQSYISLQEEALKRYILRDLDTMFSNKATPSYVNHIVQNWSSEPYIKGAYLNDHAPWRTVQTLSEPVADTIYFAGDAYTSGDDWGNVHDAATAAKRAVRTLLS